MGTITCGCSAIGSNSKLLIEDSDSSQGTFATFDSSSERYEFLYERLKSTRNLSWNPAITGSISRSKNAVRNKSYLVQGVLALQPSPAVFNAWLPRILGGSVGSTGSGALTDLDSDGADQDVSLGNVLPEFDAMVYRESHIGRYEKLQVARTIIRGRSANGGDALEFLEMIVVVVGQQEDITQDGDSSPWPGTEPSQPTGDTWFPYTFFETDVLLNGTDVPYDDFSLSIDNNLQVSFRNEQYPTCIRSTGRTVKMDMKMPSTCDAISEVLDMNTTEGTLELRMSTPSDSVEYHTQFQMPYARSTWETPTANGRGEIILPASFEAFSSSGNDELVVQNDISS